MFCTKCGFKLDDDSIFCAQCGNKITVFVNNNENKVPEVSNNELKQEPVVIPTVELEEEQAVTPIVESKVEQVVAPIVEPKEEQVVTPVVEPKAEQVVTPIVEPKEEQVVTPIVESKVEQVVTPIVEDKVEQEVDTIVKSDFYNPAQEIRRENFVQPTMNQYPSEKNKFSIKRFIFSLFVILATVATCVSVILLPYSSMEMEVKDEDGKVDERFEEEYTVVELMSGKIHKGNTEEKIIQNIVNLADYTDSMDDDLAEDINEVKKEADLIKILAIILVIVAGIATVFSIVMCCAVRKKVTYVFTLLFSLVNLVLSGYIFYLFNFEIVDNIIDVMDKQIDGMSSVGSINISAEYTMGAIIILASQLVIFISSIILLTCKNKKKMVQS